MEKPKRFKKRWIFKACTWKLISILLGGAVVYWLTGVAAMASNYLLVYTPISLVAYVAHELVWQWWKNNHRKKNGYYKDVFEE